MFSYPDAQRYRLGPNYQQLPPNAARCPVYSPYQRDGPGTIHGNYGADPNYVRSRFRAVAQGPKDLRHDEWAGAVQTYSSEFDEVEDTKQPRALWELMKRDGVDDVLVTNLAANLSRTIPELQEEAIGIFGKVDKGLAERIAQKIKETAPRDPTSTQARDDKADGNQSLGQ
jgi:catalase